MECAAEAAGDPDEDVGLVNAITGELTELQSEAHPKCHENCTCHKLYAMQPCAWSRTGQYLGLYQIYTAGKIPLLVMDVATESIKVDATLIMPYSPEAAVADLCFSADSTKVAVRVPAEVKVFDIESGNHITTFEHNKADLLAFSPDGHHLAMHQPEAGLCIYDSASGRCKSTMQVAPADLLTGPLGRFERRFVSKGCWTATGCSIVLELGMKAKDTAVIVCKFI